MAEGTTARAGSRDLRGWRVVLVHGVRTSGTMWRRQAAELRAHGAEVVAVDLPGHGSREATPFTLAGADAVLSDAARHPGGTAAVARTAVVGLSLGGYLALHWAARAAEPPDLLILSSCTARPGGVAHQGFRLLTAAHAALPGELSLRAADRWARLALARDAATDVAAGGVSLPGQRAALRAMLAADPLGDLETVLSRGGAVSFVQGEWDHFRADEREFRRVAAGRARWLLVHRAHHLVSLHRPRAYLRALLDELAHADGRSGPIEAPIVDPRMPGGRASADER